MINGIDRKKSGRVAQAPILINELLAFDQGLAIHQLQIDLLIVIQRGGIQFIEGIDEFFV